MPFPSYDEESQEELTHIAGLVLPSEDPTIDYSELDPDIPFEEKQEDIDAARQNLHVLIDAIYKGNVLGLDRRHMVRDIDELAADIDERVEVLEGLANQQVTPANVDGWVITAVNTYVEYEIRHAREFYRLHVADEHEDTFQQVPQEQLDQLWTEQNDINHQRLEEAMAAGTYDVPKGPFESTKHTDSKGKEITWPASHTKIEKKNFSGGRCIICLDADDLDGGWCMLQCPNTHIVHCSCFNGYAAQKGISYSAATCPLCRTPVTMMSPLNTEQLKELEELKEKETAFGKRKNKTKKLIISDILYLKKLNKM